VQALFSPYYDHVMPALKAILQAADGKTQRVLCGKAIECVSLVGMSVGKDVFYKDAQDFMHFLMQLNMTAMEPDNPMLTYVQSAGTRMCKCLGEDFVPLLPQFVPPLIESAGKKAELTVCRLPAGQALARRHPRSTRRLFLDSCDLLLRRLHSARSISADASTTRGVRQLDGRDRRPNDRGRRADG
jgi:hypothetical protein